MFDSEISNVDLKIEEENPLSKKKHSKLSEQYLKNLEGTKDSYSDSEESSSNEIN